MKKIKHVLLSVLVVPALFMAASVAAPAPVSAQSDGGPNLICRIFPFIQEIEFTRGLCGEDGATEDSISTVAQLIRFGLSLIFIGIIAFAVFYIIKSAIKYIRSEGDEGQVQEATKAIKAVFIGVAALILAIVGLVVMLSFFGGLEALDQEESSGVDAVDDFFNELQGT